MARLVELYMPLREAPKHYGLFVFQRNRDAALELGSRFYRRNLISSASDVFFLEWSELVTLVGGGEPPPNLDAVIAERQRRHERFLSEPAPDFLRSDGVPVQTDRLQEAIDPDTIIGTAVSAGHAKGPVRVLKTPDPQAMKDGDVLVMRFADPGWTPLFPRAAAVIMEVGGLMCHAAVVAREMGIPAVFGVRGATSLFKNGEPVEVDGSKGTIRR